MKKHLLFLATVLAFPLAAHAEENTNLPTKLPVIVQHEWCADKIITGTQGATCNRTISFMAEDDLDRIAPKVVLKPWCADTAIAGTEQQPCNRTISFAIEDEADRQKHLSNL